MSENATHPSTYVRLLRLRNIELKSWQRVIFIEGSIGVSALLVMTDLASAWVLLGLPVGVAAAVKFHDLLAGALHR